MRWGWATSGADGKGATAEVEAHATRRAAPGTWAKVAERARMKQALADKAVMAQALKQQAKIDQWRAPAAAAVQTSARARGGSGSKRGLSPQAVEERRSVRKCKKFPQWE